MASLSAPLHVSLERFHDQVQPDGPNNRRESKGGQQRADQNTFLRIVSGIADGFLYNVDTRQEEYDRQTDHEILPRSHVRRFPMGVRILMLDVLAGRYASVSCRPHI